jgi:hypothetical protein
MARHDLRCTTCGHVYRDVDIPVAQGATAYCAAHACCYWDPLEGVMPCVGVLEPVPAIRLSLFSDGTTKHGPSDFTKFTTQIETPDGGFRDVRVSSLHDIRRLERETEQAERDGWGRKCVLA